MSIARASPLDLLGQVAFQEDLSQQFCFSHPVFGVAE